MRHIILSEFMQFVHVRTSTKATRDRRPNKRVQLSLEIAEDNHLMPVIILVVLNINVIIE